MAKAKTARQIAASRKNIKKAQIASARKRKGTGKSRPKSGKKRAALGHKLKRSAKRWERAGKIALTVSAISGFAYANRRDLAAISHGISKGIAKHRSRVANPNRAAFTVGSSGVASVRSGFVPGAHFSTGHALAVVTRGMNKKRRLRNQAAGIASGKIKVVRRPVKLRMQAGY